MKGFNLKIVLSTILLVVSSFSFISCSNDDDFSIEEQETASDGTNSQFPILMDKDHPDATVVVDGKTITIHFDENEGLETRGIDDNKVYPRDPNATLASVPRLAEKGTYEKYAVKQFPPFAELAGATIAMLRLDRYTFQCVGPANANVGFNITNITPQGFATKSANYRGYSINNILVTTDGVIMNCSFYIQNGIAYGVGGEQLTADTPYPLAGTDVRYQFTYTLKE